MKKELVGRGMTAEVYNFSKDKVVKLFYKSTSIESIQKEISICKKINETNIPSPKVFHIAYDNGRTGIVFQKCTGKSMLKLIENNPLKTVSYATKMALLHVKLHSNTSNIQTQKDYFKERISRSLDILEDRGSKILNYLNSLPDGTSVCHGDFHPDNILVTKDKMVIIDWSNAYIGNPLSDVARTYLIIKTPYVSNDVSFIVRLFSGLLKRIFYKKYLKVYMNNKNIKPDELDKWILLVAAARLCEKIPKERKWLLNIIDKKIKFI